MVVSGPWRIEVGVVASSESEFEQFFLANYDSVLHALIVTTGDRERATDATQEAFIKAYSRWPKIRQYDSPAAWVRRIAINLTRDTIRSERRRRRREQANRPDEVTSHADRYVADSFTRDLLAGLTRGANVRLQPCSTSTTAASPKSRTSCD